MVGPPIYNHICRLSHLTEALSWVDAFRNNHVHAHLAMSARAAQVVGECTLAAGTLHACVWARLLNVDTVKVSSS